MSDALIVGLISAGVTLIGIVVSLIGIVVSSKATRNEVAHKLDTNQQVINNEISHIKTELHEMKEDVKSHNHYAKLFSDHIPMIKEIPVIKEKVTVSNKRIADIEDDIRFYHRRPEE
jgi:uncharacterized membrane-anchored protein YhcB (DUF1043 family)